MAILTDGIGLDAEKVLELLIKEGLISSEFSEGKLKNVESDIFDNGKINKVYFEVEKRIELK